MKNFYNLKPKIQDSRPRSGFTLLYASLIVSLLLAIGLAILNITLQQVLLASVAKESQFAFYNADTGLECALYHDRNNPDDRSFGTSSDTVNAITDKSEVSCNGVFPPELDYFPSSSCPPDDPRFPAGVTECASTIFDLTFNGVGCVADSNSLPLIHVEVIKGTSPDGTVTQIKSRGYNTCDPNNLRRVERGFQVDY